MAITVSGVDPAVVTQVIENLTGFKNKMVGICSEIQGNQIATVRNIYEGDAADELCGTTEKLMEQAVKDLGDILGYIVQRFMEDLQDLATTDQNLAK